jgi:hypothetical protein
MQPPPPNPLNKEGPFLPRLERRGIRIKLRKDEVSRPEQWCLQREGLL